jgi:hypothetical protein
MQRYMKHRQLVEWNLILINYILLVFRELFFSNRVSPTGFTGEVLTHPDVAGFRYISDTLLTGEFGGRIFNGLCTYLVFVFSMPVTLPAPAHSASDLV